MLFKKWRLNQKDFKKVLRKGRAFKEDSLILKALDNSLKKTRIGFLVTKKNFSKAVLRNKIKRKMREIIRLEFEKIKNGFDLVFIFLPGIEKKESKDLREIFLKLISKAKLLKNEIHFPNL